MNILNLKNKILLFVAFLFFSFALNAQISVNPQHEFYNQVQNWQIRKIISKVPPLRPYSVNDIKQILFEVLEKGTDEDKISAQDFLDEISDNQWNLYFSSEENLKKSSYEENSENNFGIYPGIQGDLIFLQDLLSIGYSAGFTFRTLQNENLILPYYKNSFHDSKFDPATVGPLYNYMDMNDVVAFSKNGFVFQAGVYKNGYGNFLNEGLALNDSAYHKPTISFSYFNHNFSYSQSISSIGAVKNNGNNDEISGNKFLSFHAIEYSPWDFIKAAFYETAIFGKRFDISYLVPSPFMLSQSFSGYQDSIMMGASLSVIPVKALMFTSDILVDDLSVNELVKFNFDSKNRIAWNNGIKYVFEKSIFNSISINYTIVTPFTYSHWDFDPYTNTMDKNTWNFQNYTNCGFTIGTNLPPNSDNIKFALNLAPLKSLKLKIFASYVRHGNICESLKADEVLEYLKNEEDMFATDGGINTHTFGSKYYFDTAWNYLNFLNQENKMYVFQTGFESEFNLQRNSWGSLSFNFSYVFEFIKNYGVDSNMYQGGKVFFDENTLLYHYENKETDSLDEVVSYYKNQWIASLKNVVNHFVTIGFTYRF